jgi:hypothetical protein
MSNAKKWFKLITNNIPAQWSKSKVAWGALKVIWSHIIYFMLTSKGEKEESMEIDDI